MYEWIDVKQSLPKQSGCYLCYKSKKANDFNFVIRFFSIDYRRFLTYETEIDEDEITHWMELPIPPSKQFHKIDHPYNVYIQL